MGKAPGKGSHFARRHNGLKTNGSKKKELQVPYHVEVLDTLKLVPDANRMLRRAMLGRVTSLLGSILRTRRRYHGNNKGRNNTNKGGADSEGRSRFSDCR